MTSVIISLINYNGQAQTEECLRSLEKIKRNNLEIEVVVIDNASREPFKYNSSLSLPLKILYQKKNLGFAGGHNIGIAYAREKKADYIVVLNNDTLVDPDLLLELVKTAEESEKIGAVAPKIYFTKGHEFHKEKYTQSELGKVLWYAGGKMDWENIVGLHTGVDEVDKGQFDEKRETELFTGCCVLLRTSIFDKIKPFDERYFLYYEDADLSQRVKKAGFKIIYSPKAVLWHSNAGSTGGSGSPLQDYFISRNRMLFGMNYASSRTKVALVRESLRIFMKGRKGQRKGIKDFYLQKLGKGTYGV